MWLIMIQRRTVPDACGDVIIVIFFPLVEGAHTSSGADVCVFNDRRLCPHYVLRRTEVTILDCGSIRCAHEIKHARCHLHWRNKKSVQAIDQGGDER